VETILTELNIGRAWFIASDGAPGVGKTTIAYETAQRALVRQLFDAIIWTSAKQQHLRLPDIINIAEYVTSMETILDAIGTTLGNREILSTADYTGKEKIARKLLAQSHCLLIVDNLETLSEQEQQRICTFMANLPRPSKGLITGRERRYVGLYTITLTGMPQSEALRFMNEEAARRTVPILSHADAVRIHTATHGNPLAMQQMIGLIQSLGYAMEDALAFEEVAGYEAMLNFMYAEAYDKLKESERKILQILTLFTDPAAHDAIAAAAALQGVQLTLGLQRLYRAFLVQRSGETRYELLPYARQFLRTRQRTGEMLLPALPLTDFLTAAHRRLAAHYIEYLRATNLDEQLRYLKHERKNILGLMEWCYLHQEWQLVIDLVDYMSRPLGTLRYLDLEIQWGQRGMEACDHLNDHAKREWFKLYSVAWPYIHLDDARRAIACEMIAESVKVAQTYGYTHLHALALRNLGRVTLRNGDYATALTLLQESLALWQQYGDLEQKWIAHTTRSIGETQYHLGRLDEAQEALLVAWRLYKQYGETEGLVATASDMALVSLAKGDDKRALFWSDRGLTRAGEIKKPARAYGYAHQRRAELEYQRHDPAAAAMHAAEAIATYEALGMGHWVKTIKEWLQTTKIR
jgi:tetratricopeptide (TPR) repeat protein